LTSKASLAQVICRTLLTETELRNEELEYLVGEVHDKIAEIRNDNARLADSIHTSLGRISDKFSKSWLVQKKWTPYDLLQAMWEILSEKDELGSEDDEDDWKVRDPPKVDWMYLSCRAISVFKKPGQAIVGKKTGGDQSRKNEILESLEETIENRCKKLVEGLIEKRDSEVLKWKVDT